MVMTTATRPEFEVETHNSIDLRAEVEGLFNCLTKGDLHASVYLARLIESDTKAGSKTLHWGPPAMIIIRSAFRII